MESQYIKDSAVKTLSEDKFMHSLLASEIATLALTQPAPLNIAVFGPWGSGKSSLCSLLKLALKGTQSRFVEINAWKHSEDSFRRQFILDAARQLGCSEKDYRKQLYQKTRHVAFRSDAESWKALLTVFIRALLAFFLVMAGLAIPLSVISSNPYIEEVVALAKEGLGSAIVSAGLFAAVLALMGRLFTSDTEESEISSDERFTSLFKQLIQETGAAANGSRLVFFIDELDRCEPTRVVSVLESLRTFLDVPPCVFIVAADDRVLEAAVKDELPHAVPDESTNPYYSSGAEYLDKLFQHQIAIPPLLARRLTQFALGLTEGRDGVWKRADELHIRESLVSVLIPSHVRSPRRAKVLLNAFVSAFESARGRHQVDASSPDPEVRILELAKLSTLRCEFPLFYRSLIAHPHLASHLTAFLNNDCLWSEDVQHSAELHDTRELVEQYAKRQQPTETILSAPAGEAADAADESQVADDSGGSPPASADIARRNELISYLRKTAYVPGPARDIIYLESGGAMFGVTDEVADAIETYAVDGDHKGLGALLERAAISPSDGIGLLHQLQSELVGVEASNALDAAFALARNIDALEATTANAMVDDVRKVEATLGELRLEWLPDLVRIGRVAQHPSAGAVVDSASTDERLLEAESKDTARRLTAAFMESPSFDIEVVADLASAHAPGFLAWMMTDAAFTDQARRRLLRDEAFRTSMHAYWAHNESEVDADELSDYRAVVQWAEASDTADVLWWSLDSALAAPVVHFVHEWLSQSQSRPVSREQVDALLSAAVRAESDWWPSTQTLLDGAPHTDSALLHQAVSAAIDDILDNGLRVENQALLEATLAVWGSPTDAEIRVEERLLAAPWSSVAKRDATGVVRQVAGLSAEGGRWRALLTRGYKQLISEQPGALTVEEHVAISAAVRDDWSLLDDEQKETLLHAIAESPADTEVRYLWQTELASVDEEVPIPFAPEVAGELLLGTPTEQHVVAVWLGARADIDEVTALFLSDDLPSESAPMEQSAVSAIRRFNGDEREPLVRLLIDAVPSPLRMSILADALPGITSPDFADWLAERLREAPNESRRTLLLDVWRWWAPKDDRLRKPLVEAFTVIAGMGKSTFSLVLKNLDLAERPPLGTKGPLAQMLLERADSYGETKKTKKVMASHGLGKASWLKSLGLGKGGGRGTTSD